MGTAAAAELPAAGTVGLAFLGRTSTSTMQDPVQSLHRQIRVAQSRLPDGFYIARYYWDVESGGTDLDLRSQGGVAERFAAAGIPRDGGMADLRQEIAGGRPGFAAVICENIERTGRDNFDALKLERELRRAHMPVFASDEPIDVQAPEAATLLVRRVKQGLAEYFRLNLKNQMWEGLKEYVIAGYNTGRCPYGYTEDRTTHPNPLKASMGATRARLVADPERGPWVTRMFQWRVYEQLSVSGIARRLTQMGAPSRDGGPWSPDSVNAILRNPKYTGRVVIGRTRNDGDARTPDKRKVRAVPRDHWTWAGQGNEHPALVPLELWEQAQLTGRKRGNVADYTAPPAGRRTYPLRSRITCRQCQRRMVGKTAPGDTRTYYVCPHNPNNPRHAKTAPAHARAAFRDHVVYAAVDEIIRPLLSRDRAAATARYIPATQADQDTLTAARITELNARASRAETAMNGIAAEIGQLSGNTDPASNAIRERLTSQFTTRYDEHTQTQTELEQLTAAQPARPDPALLDELPFAPELLGNVPDHIRARVYAAFQVHVLYRQDQHQATIRATITDATPQIIQALQDDPRTDSTGTRGNLPEAPIATKSLHDHETSSIKVSGPCHRRLSPGRGAAIANPRGEPDRRPPGSLPPFPGGLQVGRMLRGQGCGRLGPNDVRPDGPDGERAAHYPGRV